MADTKTHLRELSVATTIGLLKDGISFSLNDLYDSKRFFSYAEKVITGSIASARNLTASPNFTGELRQIVDNGYHLGKAIYEMPYFQISKSDIITWQGNDTQKDDPVDVTVGKYGFSLKEESFILENMGLYKLLNLYTGSHYKRRHIFSDYARAEYEAWFDVAWHEMINYLSSHSNIWEINDSKKNKRSVILLQAQTVVLCFYRSGHLEAQSVLPITCKLPHFERNTTADTRENVFSKFIKQNLNDNPAYNAAKRACAVVAAEALAKELNDNLNYSAGLPRFLRIHEQEYYYAKTTSSGIDIFRVPCRADFGDNIYIESITSSVPDKQANILTTIRNRKTGKKLVLRNECRFSHGQFNGTPEAKMYYEHGGSLLVIYEPVDVNQSPTESLTHRTSHCHSLPQKATAKDPGAVVSKPSEHPETTFPTAVVQQEISLTSNNAIVVTANSLQIGMEVTHCTYGDGYIEKIDHAKGYVYVRFSSVPYDAKPFIIKSAFAKGFLKIK